MVLDLLDEMAAELTFPSAKVSGVIVDGVPRSIELQPEVTRAVTKAALRFLRKNIDNAAAGKFRPD
ncbi:hypothetical protein MKK88_05850 [Methylobacterium sp. E-005]|uniref:hypothetical protein n=1 Tax=Methylobacterium sp. E-005 TaxID=2836549 RepID=UPI001FB99DD9|nr:hypothetical protein [Methylobacterium sp. E-005]MCJ2085518.1 hypothetical protein [Methylobacterium sp. E-005]